MVDDTLLLFKEAFSTFNKKQINVTEFTDMLVAMDEAIDPQET